MTKPAPTIAYASESYDTPADRLLRHVVAWLAMVDGGLAIITTGLHVALANDWVESPQSMSWELEGGWNTVVMIAHGLTNIGLLIGGILLLRRRRASVIILRVSVASSLIMTAVSFATMMIENDVYRSYWSTPAAAGINAIQFLNGLWVPVLIMLLTLPPLARRMV